MLGDAPTQNASLRNEKDIVRLLVSATMLHFEGVHPIFLKRIYEHCPVQVSEQFLNGLKETSIYLQFTMGLQFSCKPFDRFFEISLPGRYFPTNLSPVNISGQASDCPRYNFRAGYNDG